MKKIKLTNNLKNLHKWNEFMIINEIKVKKEDIKIIIELNKEYERLSSFYQSFIKAK